MSRDRLGEVAIGLLDQQAIPVIQHIAVECQRIRIAARAEFAVQFAAYDTSATEHAFAAMLDFLDS